MALSEDDDDYFDRRDDMLCVTLMYPRCDDRPSVIEVDLCDVRAADGLRISYDFGRGGWKIAQSTDTGSDNWIEVAFIQAWGSRVCAHCLVQHGRRTSGVGLSY